MRSSIFRMAARAAPPAPDEGPAPVDALPGLAGLTAHVRVATDFGPVPVMLLRERDRLRTASGDLVRVVAIRRVAFDPACLATAPAALPIRIEEGALGAGIPRADVTLAPHQRVAADPFGGRVGVHLAADLVTLPGIARGGAEEIAYHEIRCAMPAVILAEGLQVHV